MNFQRKYNTATVAATHIRIPIIKRGAVDFAIGTDWTPAAGDVRIRKDGGTWADINTLPTASSAGGNGSSAHWEFQFLASELQAKQVAVMIADATGAKAVEDQYFVIETFGDANAMYPKDIGTDNTTAEINAVADGILKRDWTAITGDPPRRSLWNAGRKLMNKWFVLTGVLYVKKENDTDDAYTENVSTGTATPITGSDPNG